MKRTILPFAIMAVTFISIWPAYLIAQSEKTEEYKIQHITIVNGDTVLHDEYVTDDAEEAKRMQKKRKAILLDAEDMEDIDVDIDIDVDSIVNAVFEDLDLEELKIELQATQNKKGNKTHSRIYIHSDDHDGVKGETHDIVIKSISCEADGKGKNKKVIVIDADSEMTTISSTEDGETTEIITRSGKDGEENVIVKGIASNKGLLNVYPNPSDGMVKMNFQVEKGEKVDVKVLDLKGNTVFERTYKEAGNYTEEINLEDQPKGIYMFNLSKKGYTESKKIVVD